MTAFKPAKHIRKNLINAIPFWLENEEETEKAHKQDCLSSK